jgi:protein-S-isoprenylcysteine O-methyltransferase Ste14
LLMIREELGVIREHPDLMRNHLDLFGLRQVYLHWRDVEYTRVEMKTSALYKLIRHPLMLGFLMAFWGMATIRAKMGQQRMRISAIRVKPA